MAPRRRRRLDLVVHRGWRGWGVSGAGREGGGGKLSALVGFGNFCGGGGGLVLVFGVSTASSINTECNVNANN